MGQNQASQTKPYSQKSQSWGPFPPHSDIPRPANVGTVLQALQKCLKPWKGQCQALLGEERSFPLALPHALFRETAFGEIRLFPTRGWQLAPMFLPGITPFSIIDPHPTPAPTRSCV